MLLPRVAPRAVSGSSPQRLASLARHFSSSALNKMPPVPPSKQHYDLIVIGGGSGAMGTGRRAASYGKSVALIEKDGYLGGTCVNVGCVPKKLMWHASDLAQAFKNAPQYGFGPQSQLGKQPEFDWGYFADRRDKYIERLNGIYDRNLAKDGVEYISGFARLTGKKEVTVSLRNETTGKFDAGDKAVSADHIVIATGGYPSWPSEEQIPGASLGIDSDGYFALRQQPKRVAVVGAGYIAVELAGQFHGLGSETHLIIRQDHFLRSFDPIIGTTLQDYMAQDGLNVHQRTQVAKVEGTKGGPLTVHFNTGKQIEVDALVWAIGRQPSVQDLGLKTAGVTQRPDGTIPVDAYQNTNVPGIYAVGDVAGHALLTPVAIAAGRRLSNRLFGPSELKDDHLDYNNIPTAIFAHPAAGSVGASESEAVEKYGKENVFVYQTRFTNLYFGVLDHKQPTVYKMIVVGDKEERVVGLHVIGAGSDELIQALGVLVKIGATKKDFDNTVAVHPSGAEELVTMTPGMRRPAHA